MHMHAHMLTHTHTYFFSFLKLQDSQRTIFKNTKGLTKLPGIAHYYNLTPCFRYYPINVCKAAINLASNSRLHAVLPKCRGNDRAESSHPASRGKGSIKELQSPVRYGSSEEAQRQSQPQSLPHYRALTPIFSRGF